MKKIAAVTTAVAVSLAGVAVPQAEAYQITVNPNGTCTFTGTQADTDYGIQATKDFWLEIARAYDSYTPGTYQDLASLWTGKLPTTNETKIYNVTMSLYNKTRDKSGGTELAQIIMDAYGKIADAAIQMNNTPIGQSTTFTKAKAQELIDRGVSPKPVLPPEAKFGIPEVDNMLSKMIDAQYAYMNKLEKLALINARWCVKGRSGDTSFAAGAEAAGLSEEATIGLSVTAGVLALVGIIAVLITYVPAVRALMPPQILALLPAA